MGLSGGFGGCRLIIRQRCLVREFHFGSCYCFRFLQLFFEVPLVLTSAVVPLPSHGSACFRPSKRVILFPSEFVFGDDPE